MKMPMRAFIQQVHLRCWKFLVTGESLSVREIYGKPIQTTPTCTIIVASNHPFKSDDKTDGVHRRVAEINRK